MRIGVDLTTWTNARGYGRFTRGLLTALLSGRSEHEWVLFADVETASRPLPGGARVVAVATREAPAEAAASSSRRSLHDLWAMRRAVAAERLDLFFFPTVYSWFPVRKRGTAIVLGIHDVIAEEYPELVFPVLTRRWLWRIKSALARRQADLLMTVSEYARRGVVSRFGWPEEKVVVVGEAADPVFRPLDAGALDRELLAAHGLAPEDPFLVYLGGINPHKNVSSLLRAVARLTQLPGLGRLKLALIGAGRSDRFTPGLEAVDRLIGELGLSDRVRATGPLPDESAVHLLNAASALVLPSFAEGFGLPAVEAAACGTPVVATRNSPLPELLEGGGLFVDPADPEALYLALAELLEDPEKRLRLGRRARERASELSWDLSAEQFLALVRRLAGNHR